MSQANLPEAIGWAVLNSLWQMALLWILFQFASIFIKSSRIKGNFAAILLATGFTWFIYTFLEAWIYSPASVISSALSGTEGSHAVNTWLEKALPVASAIYLVLLIVPLLKFTKNYRYVQVIRKYGLSKPGIDWRLFVSRVSQNIGLRRKVHVWISELVSSPVTIGFFKPMILIPLAALNNLSPQQLEAVLLHELSHIKRGDYLVNLLVNIIKTFLYFNPFVKAFSRIVERERERSCDEMVLQFQYDSYEYATALLTLEKTGVQQTLQLRATGVKGDLLHRVESILGVRKKRIPGFNHFAAVLSGILCIIGLNALVLLNKPLSGERTSSFAHLASSFNFFIGTISSGERMGAADELQHEELPATVISKPVYVKEFAEENVKGIATYPPQPPSYPSEASYLNAGFEVQNVNALKSYQEDQVKAAMESSKKILENLQWKMIEQSIADAFDQKEKEEIKTVYEKELSKINWNEWENNLRSAYSEIDWESANLKLNKAVTEVRLDSLQKVYNLALTKLDRVTAQLKSAELKGIPDSDITLPEIEKARNETLKAINKMKVIRNKKIVHL